MKAFGSMNDKKNNNKLFEEYYPNGQLSYRFYKKEITEIIEPEFTYKLFYYYFFDGIDERNFLSNLKDNFKRWKKFLSKLGFKELLNDDELFFEISIGGNRTNCKSYFNNGRLKFEYTLDKGEYNKIDKKTETFELFYKDCQPKFRFSYESDEEGIFRGYYQVFYNNGELRERGSLDCSSESFERYSKAGQKKEYYINRVYYKYHDNEKLHYRITSNGSVKHGPFEIYDSSGELIDKGAYNYGEMLDGSSEWYFEDGQIYQKCYYKNGILDGPYYKGNYYGGADRNWYFINGQRVDTVSMRDEKSSSSIESHSLMDSGKNKNYRF